MQLLCMLLCLSNVYFTDDFYFYRLLQSRKKHKILHIDTVLLQYVCACSTHCVRMSVCVCVYVCVCGVSFKLVH